MVETHKKMMIIKQRYKKTSTLNIYKNKNIYIKDQDDATTLNSLTIKVRTQSLVKCA